MFKDYQDAKEFLSAFVEGDITLPVLAECYGCCSGNGGGNF